MLQVVQQSVMREGVVSGWDGRMGNAKCEDDGERGTVEGSSRMFFSSAGADAVVALALLSLDVLSLCLPGVMRRGSESEAIEERTFHVLHPAVAPAARMVFGMGRGVVALWVAAIDDLVLEELWVLAV